MRSVLVFALLTSASALVMKGYSDDPLTFDAIKLVDESSNGEEKVVSIFGTMTGPTAWADLALNIPNKPVIYDKERNEMYAKVMAAPREERKKVYQDLFDNWSPLPAKEEEVTNYQKDLDRLFSSLLLERP